MKSIITNKQQQIHDAKLVAEFNNGLIDGVESCFEELYLKKSGDYFLYGRGGLKTQWQAFDGEGIKPLSIEEAQQWVKQHTNDQYEYADLWGDAEE